MSQSKWDLILIKTHIPDRSMASWTCWGMWVVSKLYSLSWVLCLQGCLQRDCFTVKWWIKFTMLKLNNLEIKRKISLEHLSLPKPLILQLTPQFTILTLENIVIIRVSMRMKRKDLICLLIKDQRQVIQVEQRLPCSLVERKLWIWFWTDKFSPTQLRTF